MNEGYKLIGVNEAVPHYRKPSVRVEVKKHAQEEMRKVAVFKSLKPTEHQLAYTNIHFGRT